MGGGRRCYARSVQPEEAFALPPHPRQLLRHGAVVRVPELLRDLTDLRDPALQGDNDFPFLGVQDGKEVLPQQVLVEFRLGLWTGIVSSSSTNRTFTFAQLR